MQQSGRKPMIKSLRRFLKPLPLSRVVQHLLSQMNSVEVEKDVISFKGEGGGPGDSYGEGYGMGDSYASGSGYEDGEGEGCGDGFGCGSGWGSGNG